MATKLDADNRRFHRCFPDELEERDQWCLHNADKVPLQVSCLSARSRKGARAGDPSTWHGFIDARTEAYRHDLGLGFQLSTDDAYVVLDLDHVRDPCTSKVVASWAEKILDRFDTLTYTSISGTGFHIWCRTDTPLPGPGVQCKLPSGTGIDIFDRKRYLAMSGRIVKNRPIQNYTEQVLDVYRWAQKKNQARKQSAKKTKVRKGTNRFAKSKTNGFGKRATIHLTDWLARYGVDCFPIHRADGVERYGLPECPWESGHTTKSKPGDAVVYVNSHEAWGFDCFHTHCSAYDWHSFAQQVRGGR